MKKSVTEEKRVAGRRSRSEVEMAEGRVGGEGGVRN